VTYFGMVLIFYIIYPSIFISRLIEQVFY